MVIDNALILFILAVVLATFWCISKWQEYQAYIEQTYQFSGLAKFPYPIQVLVFSLIAYILLMTLHMITKQDRFFLDPFVPHTIVTAGFLILLIAATTALIVRALFLNTFDLLKTTGELAGIIKTRITH